LSECILVTGAMGPLSRDVADAPTAAGITVGGADGAPSADTNLNGY
jgi:hypothetical protein